MQPPGSEALTQVDPWADLQAAKSLPQLNDVALLDDDLSQDSTRVSDIHQALNHITAEQLSGRLLRMERSILRQERISLEILGALKRILNQGTAPNGSRKTRSVAPSK